MPVARQGGLHNLPQKKNLPEAIDRYQSQEKDRVQASLLSVSHGRRVWVPYTP